MLVHLAPVDLLELLPLGRDDHSLSVAARLERAAADLDLLLDAIEGHVGACLGEVEPDLLLDNLRVVHVDEGALGLEVADERDSGRLARVTRVGLEREAQDRDALRDASVS